MRRLLYALIICLIIVGIGVTVWWVNHAKAQRDQQLALDSFLYEEFRILPVRVHLLESEDLPALDCQLSETDMERILSKVNSIWAQASIHFYLESLVREPAANQYVHAGFTRGVPLQLYPLMRPRESLARYMFHLYCIHDFQPNGATIGGPDVIFFKDSATLRAVEGGMDEPMPRVIAHQLGYGLSLVNANDQSALMANGTTGMILTEYEIITARQAVESIDWHMTPTDLLEAAGTLFQEGDAQAATQLYETLIAVPGRSPVKDSAEQKLLEIKNVSN